MGSLLGSTSPVHTYSPLLGAELTLAEGASLCIPVDPTYELGVLVDQGAVLVGDDELAAHDLGYVEPGSDTVELTAVEPVRLLLIGGPPFGEKIVMWWNFIGREHEEVVSYRAQWEDLLAQGTGDRFQLAESDPMDPLHSPPLPNARMVQRGP